jgi:transcriptional regulator with XRE-family HTH domain
MVVEIAVFHAVRMAQSTRRWRKTYLREWREFRDRSLESVAAQMELNHGQLSKIERGIHPYNQHVLEVAALEYQCSITDLLTRAPDPKRDAMPPTRRKA